MTYRFARISLASIALVAVMTLGIATVSAYSEDNVPVLLPDQIVVQQGTPVTITLNRFPPSQQLTLRLRQPMTGTAGIVLGAFSTMIDGNGNGVTLIPTTGLGTGNYLVTVGVDGATDDLGIPYTAFAVVDGGFIGPRVVRSFPQPDER